MKRIHEDHGLSLGRDARALWLRHNGLLWAEVEPAPGERRWRAVSDLEAGLQAAYEAGLKTILIVRQTPGWAQKIQGRSCGAIAPEALDDFAAFMTDAVLRYKDPPYGVKYWELWNEPDVDPFLVKPDSVFGCWGDRDDEFYGGATYAQMLQVVYPAIKAADPQAKVLIGGLLLDAPPALDTNPNPPGKFLAGILRAGGGDFFDIVSFHGYTWYDGQFGDWDMLNPKWSARGGIVAGKVSFLREVLNAHGVKKPLMLTEAGLLCIDCADPPPTGFLQAQAAYVPRLYTGSMALDLEATIWYTLDGPGWRQAALLDGQQKPRPAYEAFRAMTLMLQDARYLHPIKEFEGLTGHAFETANGEIWVLWSLDGTPIEIPAPSGLQQAYDLMGTPISTDSGRLTVGFEPIYLSLR
jgi:hypothetical protein